MAKEVNIEIKANGISQIRTELKALKGELANATDPADIERLSKAAGQLSDKIADTNEKIKVFSAGSNFEKVSNGLGLVGSQLSSMDFEGAKESAQLLAGTIKSMNPAEIQKGFKDFASTIGIVGKAFVQLGVSIMANPIFLIAAIIAAIVIAIVMLKDKLKIAEMAFNYMMIPIKALIQALKDLGDWLGITSFAEEEAAQKSVDATNKRIAANEKATASMDKEYGRQIALAKANGQDTDKLEIELAAKKQNSSKKLVDDIDKDLVKLKKLKEGQGADDRKITKEQIDQLVKDRREQVEINKDSENTIAVIKAEANTKSIEATKKAGETAATNSEKATKRAEDAEKKRIEIIRTLKDLEIANIEDDLGRELAANREKYKRELEDLEKATGLTNTQRLAYQAEYLKEKQIADKKAMKTEVDLLKEANDKKIEKEKEHQQNLKDAQKSFDDFVLENTGTQLQKDIAANTKKFDDERAVLKSKYTAEEQLKKDFIDKMNSLNKLEGESANAITQANGETELNTKLNNYAKALETASSFLSQIGGMMDQADNQRVTNIQTANQQEQSDLEVKHQKELSQKGLTEAQKKAIDDKYAKLKLEGDKKAFIETEKIKKDQFERNKIMKLAEVVLNTAASVMVGYAQAGPFGGSVGAAIAIAVGALQAATIMATSYNGGSMPSGGGSVGGEAPPVPSGVKPKSESVAPSLGLYGQSNNMNNVGPNGVIPGQQSQNITVTAIVSETEITNTQDRVARMSSSAEL